VVIGPAPVLGVSVSATCVRAVLWWRDTIQWAGEAPYESPAALADAIARLAGEAGTPVRRARVVLERDVVQLRSIVPVPPLKRRALRRYVALEAPRLFRHNGAPLVTDGIRILLAKDSVALWAGAAPEPIVLSVLVGCAQAGLALEGLGPAADVLPSATTKRQSPLVFPNGGTSEVLDVGPGGTWQSRLIRGTGHGDPLVFAAPLAALGEQAHYFAAAYSVAVTVPRLTLLPTEARAAEERRGLRRLFRLLGLGTALWLIAGGVHVGRLVVIRDAATRSLGTAAPAVDSALTARRDLGLARMTLSSVARTAAGRSRQVALVAAITKALGDSTYLAAFQVTSDGTVRLAGYAPAAARVVAQLERVAELRDVRLEGPVTRERGAEGREQDRFAVVASLRAHP
jgi:hypothetical protein